MPAVIDLQSGQMIGRSEDDAECLKMLHAEQDQHPGRKYKIVRANHPMTTGGSYRDWRDPAEQLDDYEIN